MVIKAVIFDLDGTAVQPRLGASPSTEVINAVHKASKLTQVTCATGRSKATALRIIKDLGIIRPCILSGGTEIYDPVTDSIIWQQYINHNDLALISKCADNLLIKLFFDEEFPESIINFQLNKNDVKIIYAKNLSKEAATKFFDSIKDIQEMSISIVPSWETDKFDAHITHRLATKKFATQKLLEILGVKKEFVLAIGDSDNDLHLFEACGNKVAMGTATKALISKADYIAPSVSEDGLAWVLNKFVITN